ncbi:MAG: pseudaminic acid synthase [Deltaproteobacteria bacterium]|nr:pseudaminic acid synthase [Deltaproteobacteria bacterium]
MKINSRDIGSSHPAYFIAEMSGNHGHDFDRAVRLVRAAQKAGADAVKLQTYTADTITIDCDNEYFHISEGPWAGRNLHDLYEEAHTPWEWQPKLKKLGDELGIEVFSTPFDPTSVEFLETEVGVNVYKVASFEVVDIPLLEKVASTKKPVIMSTGMATLAEIDRAVRTLRDGGAPAVALLRCVSSYPATPDQMNLATIPHLAETFGCVAGLSDHTLSPAVPVAAVALGAKIVEKHFTLSRADGGPDAAFSLEPDELRHTVEMIRHAEAAVGRVTYGAGLDEAGSVVFRKSLFVVEDVKKGEQFTAQNVRVIRPGHGLSPIELPRVFGKMAVKDICRGTPLSWEMIG